MVELRFLMKRWWSVAKFQMFIHPHHQFKSGSSSWQHILFPPPFVQIYTRRCYINGFSIVVDHESPGLRICLYLVPARGFHTSLLASLFNLLNSFFNRYVFFVVGLRPLLRTRATASPSSSVSLYSSDHADRFSAFSSP